jgi:acyl-coenzyme A synthetase/AMP-(fatty) acid ligase
MACHTLPKNINGKIDRPRLKELFLRAEDRGRVEASRLSLEHEQKCE